MNKKEDFFAAKMMRIIDTLLFIEKSSTVSVTSEVRLYPSEIHLIHLISRGKGRSATAMAEKLAITKGAVSQTVSRLEKKGIVKKSKDPFKKNELSICLTPLGEKVSEQCSHLRNFIQSSLTHYFSSLDKNDQKSVDRFLEYLDELLQTASTFNFSGKS